METSSRFRSRAKTLLAIVAICGLCLDSFIQQGQRQSAESKAKSLADHEALIEEMDVTPRVLLYLTTYDSESHFDFLRVCWPLSIANSILLKNADVFVFSSGHNLIFGTSRKRSLAEATFPGQNVSVHVHSNPGHQEGAIMAIEEALKNGWFNGYDWVIRLNPDVIIRNDTWIRETMNDASVDGIFVMCAGHIQTDFTIFRPKALASGADFSPYEGLGAEPVFTNRVMPILASGRYKYLPGTDDSRTMCRVRGKDSPVLHEHDYLHFCREDLLGYVKW